MSATFESLLTADADLVRAGFHPLTDWWKKQLHTFYTHPTARQLVGQVGRGGAKSHTSAKVALNETVFGDWRIPPGERHYWLFLSENKAEAAQRLRLLEDMLRALGVPFDAAGDSIDLRDMPRGFIVRAAQVGRVSGFRCYGYSADELAKWRSDASMANPAGEVCASANAMTVTHPGARRLLISSPFGKADYHYEQHQLGNTPTSLAINAPSWVANPDGITEQQTRELEPDDRIWRREYAALPQDAALAAFDPNAVARAFRKPVRSRLDRWGHTAVVIDPSSARTHGRIVSCSGACRSFHPRPSSKN